MKSSCPKSGETYATTSSIVSHQAGSALLAVSERALEKGLLLALETSSTARLTSCRSSRLWGSSNLQWRSSWNQSKMQDSSRVASTSWWAQAPTLMKLAIRMPFTRSRKETKRRLSSNMGQKEYMRCKGQLRKLCEGALIRLCLPPWRTRWQLCLKMTKTYQLCKERSAMGTKRRYQMCSFLRSPALSWNLLIQTIKRNTITVDLEIFSWIAKRLSIQLFQQIWIQELQERNSPCHKSTKLRDESKA